MCNLWQRKRKATFCLYLLLAILSKRFKYRFVVFRCLCCALLLLLLLGFPMSVIASDYCYIAFLLPHIFVSWFFLTASIYSFIRRQFASFSYWRFAKLFSEYWIGSIQIIIENNTKILSTQCWNCTMSMCCYIRREKSLAQWGRPHARFAILVYSNDISFNLFSCIPSSICSKKNKKKKQIYWRIKRILSI